MYLAGLFLFMNVNFSSPIRSNQGRASKLSDRAKRMSTSNGGGDIDVAVDIGVICWTGATAGDGVCSTIGSSVGKGD